MRELYRAPPSKLRKHRSSDEVLIRRPEPDRAQPHARHVFQKRRGVSRLEISVTQHVAEFCVVRKCDSRLQGHLARAPRLRAFRDRLVEQFDKVEPLLLKVSRHADAEMRNHSRTWRLFDLDPWAFRL